MTLPCVLAQRATVVANAIEYIQSESVFKGQTYYPFLSYGTFSVDKASMFEHCAFRFLSNIQVFQNCSTQQ